MTKSFAIPLYSELYDTQLPLSDLIRASELWVCGKRWLKTGKELTSPTLAAEGHVSHPSDARDLQQMHNMDCNLQLVQIIVAFLLVTGAMD